jgi:uncharacterized protein
MIEENIKKEILRRIRSAEEEHNVKVLYAVETGSRAWGFESPNSDYDVRFIYTHPKDWYMSVDLEYKRDTIEYEIEDEIDINGWDIRKALQLFWKSNPTLVEWLQSPIVYVDNNSFASGARQLLGDVYSIEKGVYHYRSIAKINYYRYLKEEVVPLKKYFYVLRPLLSIMWLEKYQKPAPGEFEKLRSLIPVGSNLDNEISRLVERKKKSLEKELAPPVAELNSFIEEELNRLESYQGSPKLDKVRMESLNSLFRVCVS